MARVTLSGIITDINGSVGGWTFQNSLSGKIVRTRPSTHRLSTTSQNQTQVFSSIIPFLWRQLTTSEQDDWATFASVTPFTDIYGNVKTLSGYQIFFSYLSRLIVMGTVASLLAPVGTPASDVMDAYTLTLDATTIKLVFATPFDHPDHQVWIFTSYFFPFQNQTNRRMYKAIAVEVTPNATEIDITTKWENRFDANYAGLFSTPLQRMHSYAFLAREDSGVSSVALFSSAST